MGLEWIVISITTGSERFSPEKTWHDFASTCRVRLYRRPFREGAEYIFSRQRRIIICLEAG